MKKLGDVLKGVVGMLLLAGLAVVLSLTFQRPVGEEPASLPTVSRPAMQEGSVATMVAQSPLPTPPPTPTEDTTFRSPLPTPTEEPTPMSPPTPTPWPTPLVTVTPGPITSKLEIIWAETTRITTEVGSNQPGTITFWRASIADLASRTSLVTMPQGYSLKNASLSPDGSKIAFTTLPPPPNSRWWLLGTLWMMSVDGTGLKELAQGIDPGGWLGPYPIWSPDSRTLAYLKQVDKQLLPSETPTVPPPPYRYEIYSVSVDGTDTRLLTSDDIAQGIYLLGWSSDSASVYYRRSIPGRGRELWVVKAVGGKAPQSKVPMEDSSYFRLSPDGTQVALQTSEGLVLLSAVRWERRVFSPLFRWIWSSDSTEIIGRSPDRQIKALNVNTGAIRDILTDQQIYAQRISSVDELLSVSPDGRWLAMKSYETRGLYLSEVNSTVIGIHGCLD